MENNIEKFSLALCGGGGKGAYQIGVWKALIDLNMIDNLQAISGTSVGALNAVLFAIGNYENAKKIWESIREETLLSSNLSDDLGLFTREGLLEILESIDLSALRNKMDVYINIHNIEENRTEYKKINKMSKSEMINTLLASSALPIAYSPIEINGVTYIDGGLKRSGNAPIQPLYENGYRNIFISALDHKFNINNISDGIRQRIDIKNKYPEAKFTELVPLEPLGDLITGTLNFHISSIHNKMRLGYRDTLKILRNEGMYFMKNNYSAINMEIKKRMRNLFRDLNEFEEFIKVTNFGEPNIKMATMGGKVFYEDICEIFGWKLQQHKVVPNHYRILDNNDVRQAWIINPDDLLNALDNYAANKQF